MSTTAVENLIISSIHVPARPCSEIDVSERRCNTACMKGVRDAGAARRTR
jgi:hypothetical protein